MSHTDSTLALRKTMAPTDKDPLSETSALAGTLELLEQFRRGDARARDLLVERSLPQLRKWARGRLPPAPWLSSSTRIWSTPRRRARHGRDGARADSGG